MKSRRKPADQRARESWQSSEQAARYGASRQPGVSRRFHREETIVRHWLSDLRPGALVIDVPCGTGRWVRTMDEMGFRYVGGDISLAMIGEARKTAENRKHVLGFANADAAQLPFRDNSADCVMLWRLLHHIHDSELRCRMLREAARVTRNKVLVSFHHPISFTYARKFIQRTFFGQAYGPTITQWRLRREAESCGLKMLDTAGFRKYVSVNWFACLVKSR